MIKKLTKRQIIENEAKQRLYSEIRNNCFSSKTDEECEDYICEFFWVKTRLFASVDALRNAKPIASLAKGLY